MKMLNLMLILLMFNKKIEISLILIFMIFIKILLLNKIFYLNINFILFIIMIFLFLTNMYFKMFKYLYLTNMISLKLMNFSLLMSLMFFFCKNIILIFMFFELSILPIFMYMIFFSVTEKKIISSFYLLIYTSIFSFMFIVFLIFQIKIVNSSNLFFMLMIYSNISMYKILMLLVFLTKIPIFFFHIWLPKAHVESSALGSMILASILLKLGGFGLILFMNFIFSKFFFYMFNYFLYLSSIYVLIICFFLNDMKMIIAYFSISHMSISVIALILSNFFSINFCILMMISHSISSPVLFFFSLILYNNYSSRMIMKINSMFNFSNSSSWLFFTFLMFNISIPPTLNFFSEIFIFSMNIKYLFMAIIFIILLILMSGLISIILIIKMMMGKEYYNFNYFFQLKMNFISVYVMFLMFSLILIFKLNKF